MWIIILIWSIAGYCFVIYSPRPKTEAQRFFRVFLGGPFCWLHHLLVWLYFILVLCPDLSKGDYDYYYEKSKREKGPQITKEEVEKEEIKCKKIKVILF